MYPLYSSASIAAQGHDAPLPDGWYDGWDDNEEQWYYYQIVR
jgi:hypothetical protein